MLLLVNASTKIIRGLKIIEGCAAPYWPTHNTLFQGPTLLEEISLEQAGSSIIYEKMPYGLIKQKYSHLHPPANGKDYDLKRLSLNVMIPN